MFKAARDSGLVTDSRTGVSLRRWASVSARETQAANRAASPPRPGIMVIPDTGPQLLAETPSLQHPAADFRVAETVRGSLPFERFIVVLHGAAHQQRGGPLAGRSEE